MKTSFIVSTLRRLWWLRDENRKAVLKAAKNGKHYRCANCYNLFKKVQIDHIIPIGSFIDWNTFMERLFCDADNLQALCSKCHKEKR